MIHLKLGNRSNLADVEHRKHIFEQLESRPVLLSSLRDNWNTISEYLPLEWLQLTPGGGVQIETSHTHSIGADLIFLARLGEMLAALKNYPGFRQVTKNLRSMEKISAGLFEIRTGYWCHQRNVTLDIVFEPEVRVNGKIKRPDFEWSTINGKYYCECKRVNLDEKQFTRSAQELCKVFLDYAESKLLLPANCRLELVVAPYKTNHTIQRIREAIDILESKFKVGYLWEKDEITLSVSEKGSPIRDIPFGIEISRATGNGIRPTNLSDSSNCSYYFKMPVGYYMNRQVISITKNAFAQLPSDRKSAIFVDVEISDLDRELQRKWFKNARSNLSLFSVSSLEDSEYFTRDQIDRILLNGVRCSLTL